MRPPALIRAAHPLPTLGVTAITAGLCALAAVPAGRAAVLVVAVLLGQLSIGWHNDYLDADRDRASGRLDKPVATGAVSGSLARTAAVVAGGLSIVVSIPVSPLAVLVPVCGWAYNAGLKSTAWSAVPYLLAFGSLPAVATLAGRPAFWPGWWAPVAGGLLGVAAHLANVLPDLAADAATGVWGLPHRLGARVSSVTAMALVGASVAVIVVGSGHPAGTVRTVVLGFATLITAAGMSAGIRRPAGRGLFLAVLGGAVLGVALFALAGGRLGR